MVLERLEAGADRQQKLHAAPIVFTADRDRLPAAHALGVRVMATGVTRLESASAAAAHVAGAEERMALGLRAADTSYLLSGPAPKRGRVLR